MSSKLFCKIFHENRIYRNNTFGKGYLKEFDKVVQTMKQPLQGTKLRMEDTAVDMFAKLHLNIQFFWWISKEA